MAGFPYCVALSEAHNKKHLAVRAKGDVARYKTTTKRM
jgi:hypothetical protein